MLFITYSSLLTFDVKNGLYHNAKSAVSSSNTKHIS
jgi:hypothetical protein